MKELNFLLQKIIKFASLGHNWDSCQALEVGNQEIQQAIFILKNLYKNFQLLPHYTAPLRTGHILLEYYIDNKLHKITTE